MIFDFSSVSLYSGRNPGEVEVSFRYGVLLDLKKIKISDYPPEEDSLKNVIQFFVAYYIENVSYIAIICLINIIRIIGYFRILKYTFLDDISDSLYLHFKS